MEALRVLIPAIVAVSLAAQILAVGLNASRDDLLYVLRRPKQLLEGILAVIVIPPIAAGLLVSLLPLEPVVKAGIMLMAISPVPPLLPGKKLATGARKEYAYGLYIAMALLTIVSVPIVLAIASAMFGRHDFISFGRVAGYVLSGVLFPLSIGLAIRRFAPALAERSWRFIYKLSLALVFAAFAPIILKAWPSLIALVGNGTLLAMVALTWIALAAGHMLGGPDRRDRATLALASAVRHPGIAIMIAGLSFTEPGVSAAILLFLLVGFAASAPYTAWVKRRSSPPTPAHAPRAQT